MFSPPQLLTYMPPTVAEETWENCLTHISNQIPKQSFRTWFAPITPLSLEHENDTAKLRLAVPDAFHTEWLESHYAQVIRKAAADVVGQDTRIAYEVANDNPAAKGANSATNVASGNRHHNDVAGAGGQVNGLAAGAANEGLAAAKVGDDEADSRGTRRDEAGSRGAGRDEADSRRAIRGEAGSSLEAGRSVDAAGAAEVGRTESHAADAGAANAGAAEVNRSTTAHQPQVGGVRQAASARPSGRGPQADGASARRLDASRISQPQTRGDGESGHATWTPSAAPQPPAGRGQAPNGAHYPRTANGQRQAATQARGTRPAPMINRQPIRVVDSRLKPEYTFDSFIEGDCNRLARSAAVAISQNPGGTSFNPFMVYGGVGLGKTHIVQAIGNHVTQGGKAERVLYVSSEQFTSQFVRSIQENRISDFSNFYRQIDLLIVDDVQFFGGKEKTQEEFFHVFNELHQTGKQIILCADRPPSEISGIEERLLSRFKWGLSADIQPPDLETRIAILQHKSAKHGVSLHPQIIDFVAERVRANIRQLEGALLKLSAHSDLYEQDMDLDAAKEILRDMIDDYQVRLEIEDIQRSVAQFYGVATELLSAKTRKREIVTARHVAMFFSKQLTSHSLKSIGLRFGGRDHSTVIHACNTIEDRIELEPAFREEVGEIKQRLERRTPSRSARHHSRMGVA